MEIYVVQAGDTIDAIANKYGISVEKLITDNALTDPYHLVPGENIIIAYPSKIYIVQEGDTLDSVAAANRVTVNELLRNNPILSDNSNLIPGQELTISYDRTASIITYGYTNVFINQQVLKKTLPYLTYLTIFNYQIMRNGEISGSDEDIDIIQLSKAYGAIPLMHLATITVQGEIDSKATYELLTSETVQDILFDRVLNVLREKGYEGVNITAQYVTTDNQAFIYRYAKRLRERLQPEGYYVMISINPKLTEVNGTVVYENIDYASFSSVVDAILFMQYKWGIGNFPPSPVISLYNLNAFLDYVVTQVKTDQIITGISTIGYIWELPYVDGFSSSNALTLDSCINLARDVGATILFDEVSQTPYYVFENPESNLSFIVWFINAMTIDSLSKLLLNKGIQRTGIWNIMSYYARLWLVLNVQYEIIKLLPEF